MQVFVADNLLGLNKIAVQISKLFIHKIILVNGEMGAGKTTLTKELVKCFGTADRITSPTFSLVNEYETEIGLVYHFDFYRIKSISEALDIGLDDYIYSNNYCFIEWADKVKPSLPNNYHTIQITVIDNKREITFI
jgi:tRNA threonylcarbamoyladenosine biosynthesis protein TsaE